MNTNDKVRLIQILRNLDRKHHSVKNAILDDLGFGDSHFWDIVDNLRDELVCKGALEECGCCDQCHRVEYAGDCRNDDERF